NIIHDNSKQGIFCYTDRGNLYPEIRGNRVYTNNSNGIEVTRYPYFTNAIEPIITLNTIYDNTGIGIHVWAERPADIIFNNIYNNGANGIYLRAAAGSHVSYNNINANTGIYELENMTASSISGSFNYWGDTVSQEMAAGDNPKNITRIFDIYDDGTKGTVYYSPWLTSAITLPELPLSKITAPLADSAQKSKSIDIKGVAVSPNGVGYVEVSPDGGITWYRAQGTHSWSFAHVMPMDGTYQILSRVIDKAGQIESPGEGVQVTIDSTLPTTTGTLENDETWTGEITLTGDVTVPEGINLTLSPGAVIKFLAFSDDQGAGNNTSRSELVINGTLSAQGTQAAPITFTSSSATPDKGDWYGIRVINGTDNNTLTLSYCTIEYASSGLDIRTAADMTVRINNSSIRQTSGVGLYLYGDSGATVTTDISDNQITHNTSHGIYTHITGTSTLLAGTINNNTLSDNEGYGFYTNTLTNGQSNLTVDNNSIH
ncbi:MAG: hypothetical protein GY732_06735, partial [Gammaproteobacteria bacterium]|nr:hypothetical protein [Gammaproteobacteria bacterium]